MKTKIFALRALHAVSFTALALAACQASENDEAESSDTTDVFNPIERSSTIEGTVGAGGAELRDMLFNPKAKCTVPAGTKLAIGKFQDGFYKTTRPASCTAFGDEAAWVFARSVSIPSSSYRGLVEVRTNTSLAVNMNYAGNKIFCTFGKCLITSPLYAQNRCFLRDTVARALNTAAFFLQRDIGASAKLRALDCYRPAYVQERMWALVPNPTWVARLDRRAGNYSKHNRGHAIDVSIEKGGTQLDFGSQFDEFTRRSAYGAEGLTDTQRANRELLRSVMERAGFAPYDGEWWHFSWQGSPAPLDLPL